MRVSAAAIVVIEVNWYNAYEPAQKRAISYIYNPNANASFHGPLENSFGLRGENAP
jgi:hypothetical protein